MDIGPYAPEYRAAIVALSLRAWRPVFAELRDAVPGFVYRTFWPRGWSQRQSVEVARILDEEPGTVQVALDEGVVVGWMSVRLHPEDDMGELAILAVDPDHQRRGVGTSLMRRADEVVQAAGMSIIMVETGDDPGHAASRAAYESVGYQRWPVARFFKDLT